MLIRLGGLGEKTLANVENSGASRRDSGQEGLWGGGRWKGGQWVPEGEISQGQREMGSVLVAYGSSAQER